MKSIETHARAFLPLNISAISSVFELKHIIVRQSAGNLVRRTFKTFINKPFVIDETLACLLLLKRGTVHAINV